MSRIYVHGSGAVSPAGWGVAALLEAVAGGAVAPEKELARPGGQKSLAVRQVPPPVPRPAWFGHARLRRTSPITQYVVAAALEAIGADAAAIGQGKIRLGVILCVMSGCVNYSRRYYDEVLRDPATASPVVFPETVFNAPASHIAALLGAPGLNYTLVGDCAAYLQGLALGANWLLDGRVDACLVAGGEESDWLTASAFHLFSRSLVLGDGAGALYLKKDMPEHALAELRSVTEPHAFRSKAERVRASERVRAELPPQADGHVLADGLQNVPRMDAAEAAAWRDWTGGRISPRKILGEGLMAAVAWQCLLAVEVISRKQYTAANVSVAGCNHQAIGAHFARPD